MLTLLIVCTLSQTSPNFYDFEIERLDSRIDALEKRVVELEKGKQQVSEVKEELPVFVTAPFACAACDSLKAFLDMNNVSYTTVVGGQSSYPVLKYKGKTIYGANFSAVEPLLGLRGSESVRAKAKAVRYSRSSVIDPSYIAPVTTYQQSAVTYAQPVVMMANRKRGLFAKLFGRNKSKFSYSSKSSYAGGS